MAYVTKGIDRTARLPALPDLKLPEHLVQDPVFKEIYTSLNENFTLLNDFQDYQQQALVSEIDRLVKRMNEMVISGDTSPGNTAGDSIFFNTTTNTLVFTVAGASYNIVVAGVAGGLITDGDVDTNAAIETYKFNLNRHDVHGTFASDTPSNGDVQWNSVYINYDGLQYTITNGSTSNPYIWWDFSSPTVFQTCTTRPTLSDLDNDLLVARNDSGTWTQYFKPSEVDGRQVRTNSIDTAPIEDNAVTQGSSHVNAGTITISGSSDPGTQVATITMTTNGGEVALFGKARGFFADNGNSQGMIINIVDVTGGNSIVGQTGFYDEVPASSNILIEPVIMARHTSPAATNTYTLYVRKPLASMSNFDVTGNPTLVGFNLKK